MGSHYLTARCIKSYSTLSGCTRTSFSHPHGDLWLWACRPMRGLLHCHPWRCNQRRGCGGLRQPHALQWICQGNLHIPETSRGEPFLSNLETGPAHDYPLLQFLKLSLVLSLSPDWAERQAELPTGAGSDWQHAGHSCGLAGAGQPEVPPAAGDHVHDCGTAWPLPAGLHLLPVSFFFFLFFLCQTAFTGLMSTDSNLFVPTGKPGAQEAIAAGWRHSHVSRLQIRGDVPTRDLRLCLRDGRGLQHGSDQGHGDEVLAGAQVSTGSPTAATVFTQGLKDFWGEQVAATISAGWFLHWFSCVVFNAAYWNSAGDGWATHTGKVSPGAHHDRLRDGSLPSIHGGVRCFGPDSKNSRRWWMGKCPLHSILCY